MTWDCAIERAKRPGWRRCAEMCESCKQGFLKRDDGRPMSTIETYGGLYFDYDDPQPEQVTLEDVAHHLSQMCRFGAATTRFYSVAEHALLVRELVMEFYPELALAALHHDSHEYILGDWPTPLKRKLRAAGVTVLDEMRRQTDIAIGARFGIDPDLFEHPAIKEADTIALFREASSLKKSRGVGYHWGRDAPAKGLNSVSLHPMFAKAAFVAAHNLDGGTDG